MSAGAISTTVSPSSSLSACEAISLMELRIDFEAPLIV